MTTTAAQLQPTIRHFFILASSRLCLSAALRKLSVFCPHHMHTLLATPHRYVHLLAGHIVHHRPLGRGLGHVEE